MRKLRSLERRISTLAGSGVLALLSTPALAGSGWDEVGLLLTGTTCLILMISAAATIFATRTAAIVITLLVTGAMSWLLASVVVFAILDVWTFFLACFVILTVVCAFKLWRLLNVPVSSPPPPDNPPEI